MIKLEVNIEVYSYKALEKAMSAYKGLADIDIEQKVDHWILIFQNCSYDEERTVKEFENYLIGMENS